MYILGISCYFHDSAAALLDDYGLVYASEEERFTRSKHKSGFPYNSISRCLKKANISGKEIDYVAFYENPWKKVHRLLKSSISNYPRSCKLLLDASKEWITKKIWIRNLIANTLGVPKNRIFFVDHHLSHAASAFFCSPFKDAAILTVDGVGEWATTSLGWGKSPNAGGENKLLLTNQVMFPHSLGLLYSAFTAFLGFEVNDGEGKVMGLAAYGQPRYVEKVNKLVKIYADGSFELDTSYFPWQYSAERSYTEKFISLFGEPCEIGAGMLFESAEQNPSMVSTFQHYADLAASIQYVTEEILLKMVQHASTTIPSSNLCIAGGVALNSLANGRIVRESSFSNVWIQPAAGDAGGALGAALYVQNALLGKPKTYVMENASLGEEYIGDSIQGLLHSEDIPYEEMKDDAQLTELVIQYLVEGKVIGWFQGRFEWGPRALGNRSILADPRKNEMKRIINRKIKFREPFRPFAPVIPEEHAMDYFDMPKDRSLDAAKFMLLVMPINPDKKDIIPAVNHFGTGRLQIVNRQNNARYYDVITGFGKNTGVSSTHKHIF